MHGVVPQTLRPSSSPILRALLCGCALAIVGATPAAARPPSPLTGPREGDPLDIAVEYLFGSATPAPRAFAVGAPAEAFVVTDRRESDHTGVTHLALRQTFGGLEVSNGECLVSVDADGRVLAVHDRFSPTPPTSGTTPGLDATGALHAAAAHLGLVVAQSVEVLQATDRPDRLTLLGDAGIALEPIRARLVFHAEREATGVAPRAVRLAWNVVIREKTRRHWWSLDVDAFTGDVLSQADWVRRAEAHATYRVYPFPYRGPQDGPASEVSDPWDPAGSPFGWHTRLAAEGHDTTKTEGNHVIAQVDWFGSDDDSGKAVGCDCPVGFCPEECSTLEFLVEVDLALDPTFLDEETTTGPPDAAVTNVFYWTNLLHDVYYTYGFDEAAGNFQYRNYDDPPATVPDCDFHLSDDCDYVFADVQDSARLGAGPINNASFSTPPDGQNPLLELHLFTVPPSIDTRVRVTAPIAIAVDYPALTGPIGPALPATPLTADVVQVVDAADPSLHDACATLAPAVDLEGAIALIDRGSCDFAAKLERVEAAGAVAAIVINDQGDERLAMDGSPSVGIPSLFVGESDGDRLRSGLAQGVVATLMPFNEAERGIDSGLANDLIVHEYSHGLTTRLVGGPAESNCMLGSGQAFAISEGWSDFFAMAITAAPGDSPYDPVPFAAHVAGETAAPVGLRALPYSFDMALDPRTYADVATAGSLHDRGAIFASAMWDFYWYLVDRDGFDANVYADGSGGNNLALQLAIDSLAYQPCQPTYLEARNALLLADDVLTGTQSQPGSGQNQAEIWCAFARRGMGEDATSGAAEGLAVSEGFESPYACPEPGPALLQAAALFALAAVRRARARRGT